MTDSLIALLNALNALSPLAVIALLGTIIYMQVKNHKQVETVKHNDLHELPEIAETLRRIEVSMTDNFAYIRAKLNGK